MHQSHNRVWNPPTHSIKGPFHFSTTWKTKETICFVKCVGVAFRAGNTPWVKPPHRLANWPGLLTGRLFLNWGQLGRETPPGTVSHRPLHLRNTLTFQLVFSFKTPHIWEREKKRETKWKLKDNIAVFPVKKTVTSQSHPSLHQLLSSALS